MRLGVCRLPHHHDGDRDGGQLPGHHTGLQRVQGEREQTEAVVFAVHWLFGADGSVRAAPHEPHSHFRVQSGPAVGARGHLRDSVPVLRRVHDHFRLVLAVLCERHGCGEGSSHHRSSLVLQQHEDHRHQARARLNLVPGALLRPVAHHRSREVHAAVAGYVVLHQHRRHQRQREHVFRRNLRRARDLLAARDFLL